MSIDSITSERDDGFAAIILHRKSLRQVTHLEGVAAWKAASGLDLASGRKIHTKAKSSPYASCRIGRRVMISHIP